jgi:hypothetical protein
MDLGPIDMAPAGRAASDNGGCLSIAEGGYQAVSTCTGCSSHDWTGLPLDPSTDSAQLVDTQPPCKILAVFMEVSYRESRRRAQLDGGVSLG